MKMEKKTLSPADEESGQGEIEAYIDVEAEKACVRKMDMVLLPFLSLMYFFNSVDRSNLANAKTDHLDTDLHFVGNDYSLLILLFYVPFGLCDLPLNLLTKKFSGRVILPILMISWGSLALIQCAAKNFAGLLVIRILMGAFEAGFFAGVVFYFTLFYKRNELGFRIAIFFGSALLAAAFSGLISYGVFQIHHNDLKGWMFLFLIEGGLTVLVGVVALFWLPRSPETAWFLNASEKTATRARSLRDASKRIDVEFDLKAAFQTWKDWKFPIWAIICFTYPVAFSTTSNFLPQIVQRLGYSVVKTNLWTVAPNSVGFIALLCIAKSSDYFRERTYHIVFSLVLSLIGMIILTTIDVLENKGVAYFACFLMAAGSYVPSCLVHSWHSNNNMDENSRAANTGFLVGLGNLAGILSAATFRTEYAPRYAPTLIATASCNGVCICFTLFLGLWMKRENVRKNKEQGVVLRAEDVDTDLLDAGETSLQWRYST